MIDGKALADQILNNIKIDKKLGLAIIMVGDNLSSQSYIKNKIRIMKKVSIDTYYHKFDYITENNLIDLIKTLNIDQTINGILIQLPLPDYLSTNQIINTINPSKDVDGLTTHNLGLLTAGYPNLIPCTALACLKLIKSVHPTLSGKNVVIIGRS